MKKSPYFGDWWILMWFLVGTGEPPPYCNKIPTKSPFCMVVVLVWKSWDWVRPPPPSLGQNPNFDRKLVLKAPLITLIKCLKGNKFFGLLFEDVLSISLSSSRCAQQTDGPSDNVCGQKTDLFLSDWMINLSEYTGTAEFHQEMLAHLQKNVPWRFQF